MFLISRFVYDAMAKSKVHQTAPYLLIHQHSPTQHSPTFYKFRYGAPDAAGKVSNPQQITVKKGATASVWSLEGFELSERVLGIFGHSSELFLGGLELIHSPFIDPGFKGQLQLVVRNFSDRDVKLAPQSVIGKVTFFDVSDTILSAQDLLDEVQKNAQNRVRERALEEISHAVGKIAIS